ncbi:MAG: sugar kinase [Propionibacteriaceae bacterium]
MSTFSTSAVPQVICLGETMILLTPPDSTSLRTTSSVGLHSGGAESNLAMNLAVSGIPVAWASRVGADPLGDRIIDVVGDHGVDTRWVERDPSAPTGVYFKDPGELASTVYYYRRGSAASRMTPAFLDRLPLAGIKLLHLSGITPGLSAGCRDLVAAAIKKMRDLPGLVSFDVNYRAGVWGVDEAAPVIAELAAGADIVLVGRDEAELLWDTPTPAAIRAKFCQVPVLVVKDGAVGASEFVGTDVTFVPAPPVRVVEPVGAGDAFGAGYLAGSLDGLPAEQRLLRGHRLAAIALTHTADVADAALIAALLNEAGQRDADRQGGS